MHILVYIQIPCLRDVRMEVEPGWNFDDVHTSTPVVQVVTPMSQLTDVPGFEFWYKARFCVVFVSLRRTREHD